MKRIIACVMFLFVPVVASAQTPVVNPCCVHFIPSPDHFTQVYDASGNLVDVVTRYDFNGTAMNSIGAIALTKDLGKPAPGTAGTIDLNLQAVLAAMTIGATYTATVTAVGPGGAGASAPSNPFVAGGIVPAPRAPLSLTVNKTP